MIALLASLVTLGCLLAAASRMLRQQELWAADSGALDASPSPVPERGSGGREVPQQGGYAGPRPQRGQLVFAEPMTDGRIGLDCLLTDTTGDDDDAGRPVHVVAALPASPWLAAVEEELVQQWLAEGFPVHVSVSGDPTASRVRIACRRTTLLLDQQPA